MRFLFESNVTLALGSLALLLNSSVHRQSRRMRWRGRLRHGQEHLVKTIPTKCYHYIRTTLSSGVCSVRSVRLAGSLQGSAGPQGRVRRSTDPRVRLWYGGQHRLLHVFLRQRWRDQELTCPLQLHLREARRCVANCRSPFISRSIGGEIALWSIALPRSTPSRNEPPAAKRPLC